MFATILGLAMEIAIQTAFLTVALWIMVKLQKLDYIFLGLLASAALASAVEKILDVFLEPTFGIYTTSSISAPITVGVLILCVMKSIQGDRTDALFTVGVGYALTFGMNLWLMGTLMGDLRPSARHAHEMRIAAEINEASEAATRTNQPAVLIQATNKTMGKAAASEKSPATNGPTNSAALAPVAGSKEKTAPPVAQPATKPKEPAPVKPGEAIAKAFSVKGLTRNGLKSSVVLNTGVKSYTIFVGESLSMETAKGEVVVGLEELGTDWLFLKVGGERVKISLH
jgi:hypothetical protein